MEAITEAPGNCLRQRGRGRIGLWIPWLDGWGAGCTVPAHQEPHRGRHDDASGHLHFTSRAPGRVASVTPTVGLHKLFASRHCQTAWPQHGCGRWCHERCSPCPSACRIVRAVPHRCCHGETREQAEDIDCACTARNHSYGLESRVKPSNIVPSSGSSSPSHSMRSSKVWEAASFHLYFDVVPAAAA